METESSSSGSVMPSPSPAPAPILSSPSSQPTSSLSCTHCGKELPCEAKKLEHERTHTGEKPFRCKYAAFCTGSFARRDNLSRHYGLVHPEEEPLPKRERSSRGAGNLEGAQPRWKKSRRGMVSEVTAAGTQVPDSDTVVDVHIDTSGPADNLLRQASEITSSHESPLSDPHQVHTSLPKHESLSRSARSEPDLSCAKCGRAFTKRQHLSSHEATHEGLVQDRAIFHCNHAGCKKSFTAKSNLRAHIRAVHSHVRFECPGCGETFAHKQTLVRHMHRQPIESACKERMSS